jgi:FtsP/CotA-like multicopper oxidase with cupredoxin domain
MRPEEVQRWRLVGSQYQDNMLLELDKHRLNVITYDGIQLGALQEMKQLLMTPGQRADVLVQAGGAGTYELNAMPFDQGHDSPTGPLARVVVAGEPLPMKLPAALPKPPLEAIRDSEITGRRTLVSGPPSRRTTSQGTGRNTPSPWTARPSIPRASSSGYG